MFTSSVLDCTCNRLKEGKVPTLTISFTVPEGTDIQITGLAADAASIPSTEAVLRYWRALSYNGRKLYGQAARLEQHQGSFTLEDIAAHLSIDYESAQSYHRTSGRTAKAWVRDAGEPEPPIRLLAIDYPETATGTGRRTIYTLPPGVADLIADLSPHDADMYAEGGGS
jgi:hypothetical protein